LLQLLAAADHDHQDRSTTDKTTKRIRITMEIQIDPHTLERAEERGATKEEIIDVIANGTPILARHGRLAKAKIYPYKEIRGKKFYEQKRVEVIYVTEQNTVVTVTVYVFYGNWSS
jgi:hypothetical protein